MTTYLNPALYNPEAAIDQLVADGDKVVLMDAFSSVYATVIAAATYEYAPTITKSAFSGGYKGQVQAETNQTESTNTGEINHYAIVDTVNSLVLAVGESSGVTITATEPFNLPSIDVDFPKSITTP